MSIFMELWSIPGQLLRVENMVFVRAFLFRQTQEYVCAHL